MLGGKLHDLGKIGVVDSVLLKPGKLSDEEFAIIKRHPVIGADILRPVPSLAKILPIVLYHHERIDGKGYPEGLKGDRIPLWARITAVGDTYHALTSDRPYRAGMDREKALQIIESASGTQLCPDCVEIFLKMELWAGESGDTVSDRTGALRRGAHRSSRCRGCSRPEMINGGDIRPEIFREPARYVQERICIWPVY